MQKYSKALIAFAGLVLTILNIFEGSNSTFQVVISLATVVGVHQVPNLEDGIREVASDIKEVK